MNIYFNESRIKQKESQLIHYKDFIPLQFHLYIDVKKRNDFLKSIDMFGEIQKKKKMFRMKMKKSSDANKVLDEFLLNWIDENPQFTDLIIKE